MLCSCGGKPSSNQAGDVVAVVGSQSISRDDFLRELTRRRAAFPGKSADEIKQIVLDEMIEFEALLAQAKAAGHDRNPEILAAYRRSIVGQFEQQELTPDVRNAPTEAELAAFYQANLKAYSTPEMVRASIIYFKTPAKAAEDKRAEVRQRAQEVLVSLKDTSADGAFEVAARKHSDDQASRYTGGDIGWITRDEKPGRWLPEFLEAVLALESVGQFSPLVETPSGFYIVKLAGKKPASVRPLNEVKPDIERRILAERLQKLRDDLRTRARRGVAVRINEQVLDATEVPRADDQELLPPTTPAGS